MGLFKKVRQAAQQGDGMVHVRGAGPIDTAVFGGPSTRSVAQDDPIWAPINGISLEDYAGLARDAQARGITDEAGLITLARAGAWLGSGGHQGRARRLGAADGPVDGGRTTVPQVAGLLTGRGSEDPQQVVRVVPHEVVRPVE